MSLACLRCFPFQGYVKFSTQSCQRSFQTVAGHDNCQEDSGSLSCIRQSWTELQVNGSALTYLICHLSLPYQWSLLGDFQARRICRNYPQRHSLSTSFFSMILRSVRPFSRVTSVTVLLHLPAFNHFLVHPLPMGFPDQIHHPTMWGRKRTQRQSRALVSSCPLSLLMTFDYADNTVQCVIFDDSTHRWSDVGEP